MSVLLRANELTKRFGTTLALDSVSFEVRDGVTGLLGANGAGKSTTIKLFLGLLKPDGGSADFLAVDTQDPVLRRQFIGYMPEHDCLPGAVSGAEFLTHMAQVSGLPPSEARTRAADALRHVGIDEERYRRMSTYSTGMKQRVKLAQALVHDPVMVLLDEPTAGLDPAGRQEMLALIRRTATDLGISMMLSSHLMGDVERTCDRVIVLEGGVVIREGALERFTGETATLVLEIAEGIDALTEALARRGVEVVREGAFLVINDAAGPDYDRVRDAVVESGALLYRLAPGRHSLTEVFMEASA